MKPLVQLVIENAEMICRLCGLESLRVIIGGKVYRYVRGR